MKKMIIPMICIIYIMILSTACKGSPKPGKVTLKTYADSLSYALGFIYGLDFANTPFEFDYNLIFKGLVNAQDISLDVLSEDQIMDLISRFQNHLSESLEREQAELLLLNRQEGEDYLLEYARNPEVKITDSGLHYRVIASGSGKQVKDNSDVIVQFTGKFISGEIFSTSLDIPESMTINVEEVIPGWSEGLKLMKEGDIYEFVLPDHLAYGEEGVDIIEPGMYLIFETELIEVVEN